MSALIFDTETTGLKDPEIIEAAWIELGDLRDTVSVQGSFTQRFKPSKPIELGALATHHIYDEELDDCPPSSSFTLPENTDYLIGHNVDYDWTAIGKPEVKRICTQALSRSLWPEADSHSQSAMLYLLERDNARILLKEAHSALIDVRNCRFLLAHIISKLQTITDWESLWLLSEAARIPKIMTFGKHKGLPINEIPKDYVSWLRKQSDIDPYLMQALTGKNP